VSERRKGVVGGKESSEERSCRNFFLFYKKGALFCQKGVVVRNCQKLSERRKGVRKEERSQKGGKESERRKGVVVIFFYFIEEERLFCQKGVVVGNKELLSERSCQKGMFKRKVLDPGVGCWLMVDVVCCVVERWWCVHLW